MLRSLLSAYPAAKVVFNKPPIRRQTGESDILHLF